MAHELTNVNGKWEFAYAGEAPWHGLGQRLPAVAMKDDIMRAAGLEWTVFGKPLFVESEPGRFDAVPDFVANVRSDTQEVLGIVSTDYRIIQNGDIFQFVDDLANTAGAKYHTAGSIRRGRQVFATAKLPKSLVVVPDDVVDAYLLAVAAHDGTRAFHLRWTSIRVVCNNTLTAAMHGRADYQYTVRHVGDLNAQLAEAAQALGMAAQYFEVAGQTYQALAAVQLTAEKFAKFLDNFMPIPPPDSQSSEAAAYEREKARTARERIQALYEGGTGTDIPGVRGTAWGAFNAVTEWIDRVRTAKKNGDLRKNAAEAAVLGIGQELRDKAMSAALALAS